METAIVYYSRDGHTRLVSEILGDKLKAEVIEIKEKKSRKGIINYMIAGHEAIKQKEVKLEEIDFSPSKFELIIFAGPVWAFKPAPAVTTFMKKCSMKGKKIVNLMTMGGKEGKSLEIMKEIAENNGAKVVGEFLVKTGGIKKDDLKKEADNLAKKIAGL